MIYGIKLFFPIFLLWALSLVTMKVVFRDLLDELELRKTMTVVLVYTAASFLSYRPELYFASCLVAVLIGQHLLGGGLRGRLAAFWMAVVLFPPLSVPLTGVPGINYVIDISHLRIAEVALLLPAAAQILFSRRAERRSIFWLDAAVISYPLLCIVVQFPHVTFTTSVRSIVEMFLDVALPYYVLTRGPRDWADLKFVLLRLLLACIFCGSVALLEAAIRRNIYAELQWVYGITWSLTHTLMRGSLLRVQALANNPVMLAMQLAFTIGLWVAMTAQGVSKARIGTVSMLLLAALVCTLSRGPLLGTIVFALSMFGLSKLGPRVFGVLLLIAIVGIVGAKMAGLDEPVIAFLKSNLSSSTEDASTIDYRSRLLDTSLELIKQSPWLGVPNYAAYMQDLVQGEGIIDVVNTYVGVTLNAGVVGLALYLSPYFFMTLALLRRLGDAFPDLDRPRRVLIQAFIGLMIGALVAIFTTSIFERIPFLLLLLVAAPGAMIMFDPAMSRTRKAGAALHPALPDFPEMASKKYADV